MVEGLAAGELETHPQGAQRAPDRPLGLVGDGLGRPPGALVSSAAGTTSETKPIWWARSADIRSWAPSSDRRMTSWKGILCIRKIGSKAAGMP